jgi:hypothetical protein
MTPTAHESYRVLVVVVVVVRRSGRVVKENLGEEKRGAVAKM